MRVPDLISKCVAFVMYKKRGAGNLSYAGTCFLVQYALSKPGKAMQYLVTARHVIAHIMEASEDGKVFIRANREDGEIVCVEGHCRDWWRHPVDSSIDVAVCPWQPQERYEDDVKLTKMDLIPIGLDLFAVNEKIQEHDIGIGDEVFCTGLFSKFVGNAKNLPIVRMGTIALMPDEPVPTKKFGDIEAFLIEIRSLGGLSGSPVFLYHMGPRLVGKSVSNSGLFFLLGLVHGHWDAPDEKPGANSVAEERLNLGIAIVVSAQKIVEVLNHPDLIAMRSEVEQFGKARLRPNLD